MPYGKIAVNLTGNRLRLEILLPEAGEPSFSGNADNLVDPNCWLHLSGPNGEIAAKVVVCRPYRRGRGTSAISPGNDWSRS